MYQIGDNIVYPIHGAGIIKAIEDKEISGEIQQYYFINMINNKMNIMIPTDKIFKLGIRAVTELVAITSLIQIFQFGDTNKSFVRKQQYKINYEKIKTGKIQDTVEIIRDLLRLKQEIKLNESEKKLLSQAQKFLLSELILIEGITEEQMAVFR